MAKSLNIPLEEEMVSILGQCGSALTNVLQSKFGCTTVLHGVDATCAGQSRKPSVFPEERFSTHLSKSFKVSVWKDDLTTHRVDAVVNAANNRLKHCGGLTKALSDAGGPAIQQDIDQYIFRQGKLSIGDAIIAPPGYLPCRNIIHAVGPNLPYNNRKYEVDNVTPQLQRAVLSILKVVKQDNLQSVAIPAVSSGLFNYPLPLCADVIVKTLKEYHDSNYSGAPLEVRLVNHDEPSVREMARACRQILGSSGSHSQPVEAQGQPPKASYSQAARSHGKGSTKPFSTPTVQLGNVSLTIKKGYIEREQVEKVENSTLKHLFEIKKRQLYQRLPVQYCDLVSRVGFQREFAPPDEQNHGEGIYFSSSVHGTEKLWRRLADEEYLYFFAAQVQTGKSTIGTPGLIVPPETPGGDPLILSDSRFSA
uniref:Protein mono-ADP-ribosyltransferase PARP9 n=1 Tax=Oncorhynchus kisutch TaxID=8019 RepID=A0A8C7I703_ONCKI